MGPVFRFKCTVCEGKFISKGSWLRHLLEPRHSDLARADLIKNWSGEETRECLIVAYSKEAVGKDERILQFFSKDRYKGIVTDFVWWKERPGIGFIQFQSRKVAKSMIASLDNHQIVLDNQQFQFRRADKFLDLEWDELLPFVPETIIKDPSPKTDAADEENNSSLKKKDSKKTTFIEDLLCAIGNEVIIPDNMYLPVIEATTNLHRVLSDGAGKIISGNNKEIELCVYLMRNWSLKLTYHCRSNDFPFVFAMILNKSSGDIMECQDMFVNNEITKYFTKASSEKPTFTVLRTSRGSANSFTGLKVKSNARGKKTGAAFVYFNLSAYTLLAPENQLWRLTRYLMSFDSRCDTLMQVVYFWANLNSIAVSRGSIAESGTARVKLSNSTPDPLGLTWMVLFFLYACDTGNKIIPSPSEILDREGYHHEPIYFANPGNVRKFDVGFTPDHDFKVVWQKKNELGQEEAPSLEIFNLVYKFFCFWDGFSEESWVINTREGKYYKTEEFIKLQVDPDDPKNKDMIRLQDFSSQKYKNWKSKDNNSNVKHNGILHMSNPFNLFWHIPFFREALEPFKVTKDKLQLFMNQLGNDEIDFNVNSKDFVQTLFKI